MPTKPACRIDGILAADANTAVIFRRGPTAVCEMLVWDLNTDIVTPGQWLRARVYTRRSDVSPDGKHVIISASSYANWRRKDAADPFLACGWTAISHPPYFSGL